MIRSVVIYPAGYQLVCTQPDPLWRQDCFFGCVIIICLVSMIWVIMAYILVSTISLLTFGRVADLLGRVRMYCHPLSPCSGEHKTK